jgi:hypothetical protein
MDSVYVAMDQDQRFVLGVFDAQPDQQMIEELTARLNNSIDPKIVKVLSEFTSGYATLDIRQYPFVSANYN